MGISQRTQEDSIDALAETVLSQSKTFRKILAFNIPKTRSFMHLDTVFTMVDRDKFTVHPNILGQLTVFVMELDENRRVKIRQEDGRLEDILKEHLNLDRVTLIPSRRGQRDRRRSGAVERRQQHAGHRRRRGGGLLPELCHQPLPGGGGHPHPHHPQRGAEPGPGRPPVHEHAPVEGGPLRGAPSCQPTTN